MRDTQAEKSSRLWIDFRQAAFALALGLAVFLAASVCESLPRGASGELSFWFTNGIPLAVLLRTPERRWPALVTSALVGGIAAAYFHDGLNAWSVAKPLSAVVQTIPCVMIFRKRFGPNFEMVRIDQLAWLAGLSLATTTLRVAAFFLLAALLGANVDFSYHHFGSWLIAGYIGLFVFSLPILAITDQSYSSGFGIDRFDLGLIAVLVAILVLVFGPTSFLGVYVILPILMLLGWRHGPQGAGIGSLLTITIALSFTYYGVGAYQFLEKAGFGPSGRAYYVEFFFIVTLLGTLPIALARKHQIAMSEALAEALKAADLRADQLAKRETEALKFAEIADHARERLRQIIETSTDVICTVNAEGLFVEVSENCGSIWGWPRDMLLGRSVFDLFHPEDRDRSVADFELLKAGQPQTLIRKRFVTPDGSIVPISWSSVWIEKEQLSHHVCRDMSELDALESQIHETHRMEALGQLSGGIAHDFNNLLTIMIGNCETLTTELQTPRQRRLAELSLNAAVKGSELIRQLLAFARRQPLEPRSFDVNVLLDSSAPLIANSVYGGLELSINKSADLRLAFADPLQTETAILNLCLNARDAMRSGGKLVIETANATLTEDHLHVNPDATAGDYVMISVSDTGTGMTEQIMKRIFEPFFTTKDVGKGSGLGLSMVHGFIKQSHGNIELISEPGKGTTFRLYLPASMAEVSAGETQSPYAQEAVMGTEHVLIVEDNAEVLEHVRDQFNSLGYRLSSAINAKEALTILESCDTIDLVFTDVVMPGEMTGRDLGECIARKWPRIHVLYTSGYSKEALIRNGRLVDGVTLLPKPFTKGQLSRSVRAALDGTP